MNQFMRTFFLVSLVSLSTCSLFAYRSQGRDAVRKMVGSVGHTHLYGMDEYYGTFDVMTEYTRSFNPDGIVECLFRSRFPVGDPHCSDNDDLCDSRCIHIQGSQVKDRDPRAWLADYFYLPTDFDSSICFTPRVSNFIINFDFFEGLDPWWCGAYFRIYGPVVWSKWELNFCECVNETGTSNYEAGYFGPNVINRNNLLTNFTEYASGNAPKTIDGVTFNPLKFSQIRNNCDETRVGFADLRFELGWDFILEEDYHLGVNLQGAVPTGNKKNACFLFEPIVGNGNHWELGAGLTGSYVFWKGCNEDKSLGFYLDANITHLFGAHAEKTFDLCRKPNSKYMLAQRLCSNEVTNLTGRPEGNPASMPPTLSDLQFANEFSPVANLTTFETKISVGVQADIVLMFNINYCGISWDLGYNFWGRSCEKFSCDSAQSCGTQSLVDDNQQRRWALKGDARVFGFAAVTAAGLQAGQPVGLAATQSKATISNGTNANAVADPANNIVDPIRQNAGIDRPQFAFAGTGGTVRLLHTPGLADNANNQILTSIQPITLTRDDIGCESTRSLSHKVFTHLSYTWEDFSDCWIPYLGFGGFAEFGKNESSFKDNCVDNSTRGILTDVICKNCIDCPLSQWGVWLKGGVSF